MKEKERKLKGKMIKDKKMRENSKYRNGDVFNHQNVWVSDACCQTNSIER